MPRYLIERRLDEMSDDEVTQFAARSKEIIAAQFPDIVWEHSHVCATDDGRLTTFCVYSAPDRDQLHEHADVLGAHEITDIHEVVGDVSPGDLG